MHIETRIDIPAGRDRVWHLLTDPEQLMRWSPGIKDFKPRDEIGPPKRGQRSTMKMQEGNKLVEYESEILDVVDRQRLTLRIAGGNLGRHPMTVRYDLSDQPEGTTVEYAADWKPSSFLILLAPLITWMSRRNARQQMQSLRNAAAG